MDIVCVVKASVLKTKFDDDEDEGEGDEQSVDCEDEGGCFETNCAEGILSPKGFSVSADNSENGLLLIRMTVFCNTSSVSLILMSGKVISASFNECNIPLTKSRSFRKPT